MRILIIGSQGFVGSYILLELVNKFGVIPIYSTSLTDTKLLGSSHCSDIRLTELNIRSLSNFIYSNQITCVVNAAGVIGSEPDSNPDMKIAEIIINSVNLLKKKPTLIHIGSSSEYTSQEMGSNSNELSECHPSSAYGKNKLAVTKFLLNASAQLNFKLCVCRVFNIIGPGMNKKTILGRLHDEVVIDRKTKVDFLSLASYRDYIDIRDVSNAVVKLIVCIDGTAFFPKILNVGSGTALEVRSLINQIKYASNNFFEFTELDSSYGDKNIIWQQANIDQIKAIINWDIKYTMSQSIEYFLNKAD